MNIDSAYRGEFAMHHALKKKTKKKTKKKQTKTKHILQVQYN